MRKSDVLDLLERMPEEFDSEDLMYRIYVLQKIAEGERALREGRVVPHEEVVREVQSWRS